MSEELYTADECVRMGPGYYPSKVIGEGKGKLVGGNHGLLVLPEPEYQYGGFECKALYMFVDTEVRPKWHIRAVTSNSLAKFREDGRKFGPRLEVAEVVVSFKFKE